jgi:hypothetical protein
LISGRRGRLALFAAITLRRLRRRLTLVFLLGFLGLAVFGFLLGNCQYLVAIPPINAPVAIEIYSHTL